MGFGGLLDDDAEDVTDLNLQIETAGVPSMPPTEEEPETVTRPRPVPAPLPAVTEPLPADEEFPTALVAPETLRREIEKSRNATEPPPEPPAPLTAAERKRPIVTPSEPFVLSSAAQVETLMASSLHRDRHELPTAPAAFPVVKLDAMVAPPPGPAGPGGTVVIPKSTLDEVLGPRGPKGTAKMAGAPDAAAPLSLPVPAAARVADEPIQPRRRGSRVALALLVILAAVVGAVVSVYLLDGPRH